MNRTREPRRAPQRPTTSLLSLVATLVLVLGWASGTSGQAPPLDEDLRLQAFDLQLFRPPAATGTTFLLARPEPLRHLSFEFGLAGNLATDVFRRFDPEGASVTLVGPFGQGEVLAAVGLFEILELGLAVPLVLAEAVPSEPGPGPGQSQPRPDLVSGQPSGGLQTGASDLTMTVKVPILRGDFALAARVAMHLPPCAGSSCASIPWFASTRYWTLVPELVLRGALGPVELAGSVAYALRQRRQVADFVQDDEIRIGAGLAWRITPEFAAILDGHYRVGLGGPLAFGRAPRFGEMPLELDAGVRLLPVETVSLEAGLGTGVIAGYGAPLVRGFVSMRVRLDAGGCALGPEDTDGFEDGDFCLDPDNDGDGIEDVADRCPNDPEDVDGFEDGDGCPESDNDGDSVPDARDVCPTGSEDADGFQDEDGCPEPDNDEDGVPDGLDRCLMDPEDADGFQDEDGCPEPGPQTVPVTVSDTRILIGETIYFEFDTDVIRPVSMPLLDQVAEVIGTLEPSLRIRVEGHTDNVGAEDYNVDLSFRRARSVVEYLVGRGVARERLEYRGYGSQHPVAPNDSPQGRALNRRVEFTILRPGESASPTRRRSR